ncbi:MAG: CopG family transcriptional regulator [Desulfurococcaceae archaeon]|nr:CopG family transcriptional regulator [Desulfurococcaceae archaeon]MCC6053400.1 CopG family transcriptional regulator [Desulfurococcaceae archaeon]
MNKNVLSTTYLTSGVSVSGRKTGIYIPSELERELEALLEKRGGGSISQVVQEALRSYLSELRIREKCVVVGSITVLYNHDVEGVDSALTDLQHDYMDIILFANHVHLDRENCLLTVVVRGLSERVEELTSKLTSIRGVRVVKPTLICTS